MKYNQLRRLVLGVLVIACAALGGLAGSAAALSLVSEGSTMIDEDQNMFSSTFRPVS